MGADLTYKGLQRQVAALEKQVIHNADAVAASAKVIDEEAKDTRRTADRIAAKGVDKDSVAEAQELSKIIGGVSDGINDYAACGRDTARQAKACGDQARASHGGFQEAFDRSSVDGLENVHRDWFEQE